MKVLILLFLSLEVFALTPHKINYSLEINGWKVADEVRILRKENGRWTYSAEAKTIGIAKLFKDRQIRAISKFTINNFGVDAINYQKIEASGNKIYKNIKLKLNSKNQKASTKTKTWKLKKSNVVDPLSLFLALSYDLKNQPQQVQFNYQEADGKRLKHRSYHKIGFDIINIKDRKIKTIKISDGKNLNAWFAPSLDFLPILIEKDDNASKYRYQMQGKIIKL